MAQNNQKTPGEDSIILFLALIVIIFIANWYFQGVWKYGRLTLYKYYTIAYYHFFDLIGFVPKVIEKAYDFLTVYEPREITTDDMSKMARDLFPFFSLPFIAIVAVLYVKKLYNGVSYNRIFTRKSLVADQKKKWLWLYPVADLPLDPEIEKGEWAMAKRPLDFVKKYRLLDENNNLLEDKASVILSQQLGDVFKGFEHMQQHEQALMAIFAAHSLMSKESKAEAVKWLGILSITHDNPDYSWVKDGWEKYKNSDKVREALNHGYNRTVLMRMLENARGVLPTSYFIWLKKKDRGLYFALNCLGRQEDFVECAGVINHFFAEKVLGRPLLKPYLKESIGGLKEAIASIKITDNNYYKLEVE